eukprot:2094906-Alexandrium_andersonii.AAC.1
MSASLVGSEMCIRDSGIALHPSLPARCEPRPGRVAVGELATARSRPQGCLLYTSDAADDM